MRFNAFLIFLIFWLLPSGVFAVPDNETSCMIDIPDRYFEFGRNYPSADLDPLFCPFAETIKNFVVRHNLLIQKYYHDASTWSLLFEHPLGGQAKIDIWIRDPEKLEIQSVRWQDEYSKWTRSLKWGEKQFVLPNPTELSDVLSRTLDTMLRWRPDDWDQVAGDYQQFWSRYSKDEFEAMTPSWPKVKP